MENLADALKAAGWSEDVINSFLNPEVFVTNPVPMSTYIVSSFAEQYDELDIPIRLNSSTLIICNQ